jgi:protein-S-isoprenylcysteine O-methyltransferase Ste14
LNEPPPRLRPAIIVKSIPFSSHRIAWSRVAVIALFAYAVFVPAPAAISPMLLNLFEWVGFGLLVVAALGRVWCLSYIAGMKNEVMVTEGPYSVVRNPLYVFNFIGAVGFGFAVENPVLAALLATAFAVFYPSVIRQEEEALTQAFGERFARYCDATPRWFPRWSNYHEPESWNINPRRFRAGLLDAMWFLWAFLIWEVLKESGALQWIRSL